ncbi:MAG: DUF4214 domain-containing protein [Candidatus Binatia bacterium]
MLHAASLLALSPNRVAQRCYQVFFHREADLGGFQFWLLRIRKSGGDYAGVIDGFLQSEEYLHRSACGFGPSYCH